MNVHLVNSTEKSFGTAVITPRWLYVLDAATLDHFRNAQICDETLEQLDPSSQRRPRDRDRHPPWQRTPRLSDWQNSPRARRVGGFGGIHATLASSRFVSTGVKEHTLQPQKPLGTSPGMFRLQREEPQMNSALNPGVDHSCALSFTRISHLFKGEK